MQPANINQIPGYPYHPQQQPQTEAQAHAQAYITDTSRRQSMPPAFAPERPMPSSENSPPHPVEDATATAVEKRAPAKSRSMYTPIGPSDSMLAQHFGFGSQEPARSQSVDVGQMQRKTANSAPTAHVSVKTEDRHEYSPKSVPALPPPPPASAPPAENLQPHPISRTNSIEGAKPGVRPRLKVRIPSEHSDAGSATEESSPRASSGTTGVHSAKGANEGTHGTVHLPPPSPSVSALLSAGTTGPSNPFARPPPASTAPDQTPISALPSRFTESMLPSPSAFYPDSGWGMPFQQGRGSNGDNMLPSPLNFQTPVGGSTSSQAPFKDADASNKRKSPEPGNSEGAAAKRRKS
jgi:MADS-box transcription factor